MLDSTRTFQTLPPFRSCARFVSFAQQQYPARTEVNFELLRCIRERYKVELRFYVFLHTGNYSRLCGIMSQVRKISYAVVFEASRMCDRLLQSFIVSEELRKIGYTIGILQRHTSKNCYSYFHLFITIKLKTTFIFF